MPLAELCATADTILLHASPLTPASRASTGHLGYLGLDVCEHEKGLFFHDHSAHPPADPVLAAPNVLLTGHQAFLTRGALASIAAATCASLAAWQRTEAGPHEL
ncbi:Rossmann-fold NAD(P)-binding domain-containing protein [Hymenobacter psychrophilus]|uniref:D-lactate dehydrogenase n=1 Tax=Hymenobacter psychrophilus TaxID=651662 RepID=A0A1H3K613_9BACT|nr:hypothetical protein [Hymenobacter psychrophilus]SDY47647.1 D-lactate dehydrogenase [Hymenobacter psychrophilus]